MALASNVSAAPAPHSSSSSSSAATAGDAVSCAASGSFYSRYVGCLLSAPIGAALYDDRSGALIGTASWTVYQKVQLYKNENSIDQTMTIVPQKVDPALKSVSIEWTPLCAGQCSSGTQEWVGTPTWTPGDQHSVTAGVGQWWTGTSGVGNIDLSWTFKFSSPASSKTPSFSWSDADLKIRCDVIMGKEEVPETKPGCVFQKYIPTLPVNSKKYPAAAALYWLLMEKLETHPGSKAHNSPLTRQADEDIAKGNRGKMCPSSWKGRPNGTADAPSCDEYPFAKSRQSGGQSVVGDQCAQFYSVKENGRWALEYDDNSPLPTWQEVCGRGAIPLTQNTGAGGQLGRFTTAMRLHDKDAYYVDTPGFENCNQTLCSLP
ncbi:hypothetical protein OG500_37650 [Kitasatospora sp. NBC_01250]|uniref:hypothetical protein n=1 Tax=Kitasatospora sp. NBC_01250 TaxID=2903571 RepID=UPI002E327074|nr:hypothetical protein [Kitasatospora sp. NBC_01250]